jgi:hypothetical protein
VARPSAVRLGFVVGVVALTLAAFGASSASAGGSLLGLNNDCGTITQPFARFGDNNNYTFGANGGLEQGATGWTLSNAAVVKGNESYYVHSTSDKYALALGSGGNALSPNLCQSTTSKVVRFFVRSDNGGRVRVQIVLKNLLGQVLGVVQVTDLSPGASWQPGPPILNLDSLLGLVGVSSIQLKFTTLSGSVQLDDVYVDPWAWRG